MFRAQWLIIRNKLLLELQLASQYHYSILYIFKGVCINKVACILHYGPQQDTNNPIPKKTVKLQQDKGLKRERSERKKMGIRRTLE
jgi:hypothetical protein